ncbi:LuxR C-terminal-related transcriptional regulator [Streptomyces cyaneofuscatus]|uniref:LuxR C-terminal-related transcriptional regulator n=1 Tax=Streptomyces cyaneofuscatus TaxID=66883 RepID=UPI0036AF21BC
MSKIRYAHILIVDNDPMRTQGILQLIKGISYVDGVTVCTGTEVYAEAGRTTPDIALLGPSPLPDEDRIAFTRLNTLAEGGRFVTFGSSTRSRVTPHSMAAGLSGFLPSGATPGDFERALASVLAGFTYFPRNVTEELSRYRRQFPELSPREQEVLDELADGMSNHQIGRSLGIKEVTVKMYVTRILAKLRVESRLQACLKARGLCSAT